MSVIQRASLSDVGRKRRANQDSCGEYPAAGDAVLLVCCDGMGGHQGGEVASQIAVETIGSEFDPADPAASLGRAFQSAHARVQARAAETPELHGMGTTGVALYYDGDGRAFIAHVGDSRCYRARDGKIEQLTADHSIVAELLRAGRLTPEAAASQKHNELSRAIGASPQLSVDCAEHDARDGDRFLLCSDGLWNLVEADEIAAEILREAPERAVRRLVDLANERGGTDNVTVQVLGIGAATAPAAEEDDTEGASHAREAIARARARKRADETRVAGPDEVPAEAIWQRAQAAARERRDRRIRAALLGGGAAALALALLLLFVLLKRDA